MEQIAALFGGFFGIAIFIFLLVLAILWFALPFAIFGIQPKLKMIIEQLGETNELLSTLANAAKLPSSSSVTGPREK